MVKEKVSSGSHHVCSQNVVRRPLLMNL